MSMQVCCVNGTTTTTRVSTTKCQPSGSVQYSTTGRKINSGLMWTRRMEELIEVEIVSSGFAAVIVFVILPSLQPYQTLRRSMVMAFMWYVLLCCVRILSSNSHACIGWVAHVVLMFVRRFIGGASVGSITALTAPSPYGSTREVRARHHVVIAHAIVSAKICILTGFGCVACTLWVYTDLFVQSWFAHGFLKILNRGIPLPALHSLIKSFRDYTRLL